MSINYEGNFEKLTDLIVFLDRDGVINKKRIDYVKNIDEFIFLPNSIKAIKELNKICSKVIIVTNQSIINRGIISEKKLQEIHDHMLKILEKNSCQISKIYFCPHRPDENCECRKPKTGMLEKAIKEFKIDITKSWLIGDDKKDIQVANTIGLKSIKIETNGNLEKAVKIIKNSLN